METNEIGVVVPTWNSAITLDWTLLSLRSIQKCYTKIIVADSGSTDGTLEICERWGVDSIYVPPGNMYRAINAGMQHLNVSWLTYLNSDDMVYGEAYERLIRRGDVSKADVVYGGCDYVDSQGRFLYSFHPASPRSLKALFRLGNMGFAQPSAIFRKEVFEQLGGFSESYRQVSDADFYTRAAEAGKLFARLEAPSVCSFRLGQNQLHHKEASIHQEEKKKQRASIQRKAAMTDWLALLQWRMGNLSNYTIRFLRTRWLKSR